MVVEESVHYPLLGEEAEDEWISNSPVGTGNLAYGSTHRSLYVAMFHELHCVRQIRRRLANPKGKIGIGHARHCLQYLREATLCQADTTLERGDFMKRNFTEEPIGATHICRDWTEVYTEIRAQFIDWFQYLKVNNHSCELIIMEIDVLSLTQNLSDNELWQEEARFKALD
jgi:hypothetical protein